MQDKSVVSFGAGCVGRGFLGQLFFESGYQITFVEIDDPLIAAFNARDAYTLRLVDNDWQEEIRIPIYQTLHSNRDASRVVAALANAPLVTTAVGTRSLPDIAPLIAAGIVRRAERNIADPLNVLICENMKDASGTFSRMVLDHIPPAHHEYVAQTVGFVDVVIGRTIPRPTPEMRTQDTSLMVAEDYKELPVNRPRFVGPLPEITGIIPVDKFTGYIDRKLHLHNCGHAILGYLGYLRGHTSSIEALDDPIIHRVLTRAFAESKTGLAAAYAFAADDLDAHATDLLQRFANRALTDTVFRLARDPLRKLGPKDRLVGPARLVTRAGLVPDALSWGIAAGYLYDYPDDPLAVELRDLIAAEGIDTALYDVSAIRADEPLGKLVKARYQALKSAGPAALDDAFR